MNDLITDVKKLELETIRNLKNSKSRNTVRAYESDFRDFSKAQVLDGGELGLPAERAQDAGVGVAAQLVDGEGPPLPGGLGLARRLGHGVKAVLSFFLFL